MSSRRAARTGRHGVLGADHRTRQGRQEPVSLPLAAKLAGGPTVSELEAQYLEEHVPVHCKPKTAGTCNAFRLLMLTGCRKNEILSLPCKNVDLELSEMHLPNAKTGARTIHLSSRLIWCP